MKTIEKQELINKYIEKLNKRLEKRTFKVGFLNKGANNYCLQLINNIYKFNTYDDIISCLSFIDDMFENATKEIKK